jgi:hypothetical protein
MTTIDLPSNGLEILTLIRLDTTDFRWMFGNNYFFYYDKISRFVRSYLNNSTHKRQNANEKLPTERGALIPKLENLWLLS